LSKANWHDQRKILETIDGIKIGKRRRRPKRLGLDKGYDTQSLQLDNFWEAVCSVFLKPCSFCRPF
jgi:hypothetical protein